VTTPAVSTNDAAAEACSKGRLLAWPEPDPEPPELDDLSVVADEVELTVVAEQPRRPVMVITAVKQRISVK
jgi:hypothetical protein